MDFLSYTPEQMNEIVEFISPKYPIILPILLTKLFANVKQ